MKRALVFGAGGFIGSHLVSRLKAEGCWVRAADAKRPLYSHSPADEFLVCDLRQREAVERAWVTGADELYQLAADMGGAGFVFTGAHDAEILHNSAQINLNVLKTARERGVGRIFFSSSACIYPEHNQSDPANPNCREDSAYPAAPDSEYGWEKLFSERLYFACERNHGLKVRVARYHNVFGPEGAWNDGREKSPAALCRKVAEAPNGGEIEIWGDGTQTRSFLYVDECVEGTLRLTRSEWSGPVNIGSEEMISIQGLAEMIMRIAGKRLTIRHVRGPIGVRGRRSDNQRIREALAWAPSQPLEQGIRKTYSWIAQQIEKARYVDRGAVIAGWK